MNSYWQPMMITGTLETYTPNAMFVAHKLVETRIIPASYRIRSVIRAPFTTAIYLVWRRKHR